MSTKSKLHSAKLRDTKFIARKTATEIERKYAEAAHALKVLKLLRDRKIDPDSIHDLVGICERSFRAGDTPGGCVWRIIQHGSH